MSFSIKHDKYSISKVIDQKKYIVLEYYRGIKYWNLITESREGVSIDTANKIFEYYLKIKGVGENELLIVEVPN
ncbi:hypothetical protein FHQ28_05335 [Pasteurellaceae bacterium USgator11]|nr:hypothetical protein FHQ19_09465 [Pasteurellaceae bacterium UScroc12]TNG94738.1 hypothetical protein FHQ20_08075 [Pasteurellaceae bacterium USgator41]TNG97709.1 hypothetical protein FHQ24_09865 [Pasteurellaceae bacterium UScroc31]TNH01670.1 hypothetical protein FHQ28_05335 [Pasteurellaceae bacterium USgator11]